MTEKDEDGNCDSKEARISQASGETEFDFHLRKRGAPPSEPQGRDETSLNYWFRQQWEKFDADSHFYEEIDADLRMQIVLFYYLFVILPSYVFLLVVSWILREWFKLTLIFLILLAVWGFHRVADSLGSMARYLSENNGASIIP